MFTVAELTIDPLHPATLYAGMGDQDLGVYQTRDGGAPGALRAADFLRTPTVLEVNALLDWQAASRCDVTAEEMIGIAQ